MCVLSLNFLYLTLKSNSARQSRKRIGQRLRLFVLRRKVENRVVCIQSELIARRMCVMFSVSNSPLCIFVWMQHSFTRWGGLLVTNILSVVFRHRVAFGIAHIRCQNSLYHIPMSTAGLDFGKAKTCGKNTFPIRLVGHFSVRRRT